VFEVRAESKKSRKTTVFETKMNNGKPQPANEKLNRASTVPGWPPHPEPEFIAAPAKGLVRSTG
jgi:hypothetical protein